jgi:hypothetical protein
VLLGSQDITDHLKLIINSSTFDNIEAQGNFSAIMSTNVEKVCDQIFFI